MIVRLNYDDYEDGDDKTMLGLSSENHGNDESHWISLYRWKRPASSMRHVWKQLRMIFIRPSRVLPIHVSLSSAHIDNQAVSFSSIKRYYFDAFFVFAHRALTAAIILARPSADNLRFFLVPVSVLSFGLPGPRFTVAPARIFLACSRRAISISSSAIICLILMEEVYQAYLEPVTSDVAGHLSEKHGFSFRCIVTHWKSVNPRALYEE